MSTPVRNPSVNACGIATSLYKGGISVTKSKPPLQRGGSGIAAGGIAPETMGRTIKKQAAVPMGCGGFCILFIH